MVDASDAFSGAVDAPDLLRRYATVLATEPRMDTYEVGLLRQAFVEARSALPPATKGGTVDLDSREAWHKAYLNGRATTAQLKQACGPWMARSKKLDQLYRRLLEHHPAWLRARFDPKVPRVLLEYLARVMVPGRAQYPLKPDRELRASALTAWREHPELVGLAPRAFGDLLRPAYKGAKLPKPGSRVARTRAARTAGGTQAMPWWVWGLVLWGAMAFVRTCRSAKQPTVPGRNWAPSSESYFERMEEQRKRREDLRRMLDRLRDDGSRNDGR